MRQKKRDEDRTDGTKGRGAKKPFNLLVIAGAPGQNPALKVVKWVMALAPLAILALLVYDALLFIHFHVPEPGDPPMWELITAQSAIPGLFAVILFMFFLSVKVEDDQKRSTLDLYENGLVMATTRTAERVLLSLIGVTMAVVALVIPVFLAYTGDRYLQVLILEVPGALILAYTAYWRYQRTRKKATAPLYKRGRAGKEGDETRDGREAGEAEADSPAAEGPLVFHRKRAAGRDEHCGRIREIHLSNSDNRTRVFNELTVITSDGVRHPSGPKDPEVLQKAVRMIKRRWKSG